MAILKLKLNAIREYKGELFAVDNKNNVTAKVDYKTFIPTAIKVKESFILPYNAQNSVGCYSMIFQHSDIVPNTEKTVTFTISSNDMLNDSGNLFDDYNEFTKLDEQMELVQTNSNYVISSIVCVCKNAGKDYEFRVTTGIPKKQSDGNGVSRLRVVPFSDDLEKENILSNVIKSKFNILNITSNNTLNFVVIEEIDFDEIELIKNSKLKSKTINVPKEKWSSNHFFSSDIIGRYDVKSKIIVK